jgi:tRNA pseudouridine55 synthase
MAAASAFIGKISQVPPMYSAIKMDGKKLYELAREGITVERKARDIEIYGITLVSAESGSDFLMDVSCSKGTYIRTLCEDIGNALGVGGALYSLERTCCGEFSKENAVTIDELSQIYENEGEAGIEKLLVSPEKVFCDKKTIKLSPFYSRLCRNGCEIYLSKLGVSPESHYDGELIRLYDAAGFFAIGKIGTFRDGVAVKAAVRFRD